MQAVILAGGRGRRLEPLTKQVPKVMVSVNGRPFVLHLLELLKNQGYSDIILCIGYLGEQVKDFFGNGRRFGLSIQYSEERGELRGTGGALKQAQSLLDDYFLVINGDTYLPIDYTEVARFFTRCGRKALVVVYDNKENTNVKNNVALDKDLRVIRYDKESPEPNLKYVDAGVLVLKREVLDNIPEGCPISLEEGLYPTLVQQRELAAYITDQRFYDIGSSEQLKAFEEFLQRRLK